MDYSWRMAAKFLNERYSLQIRQSFALLPAKDQRKLRRVFLAQVFLGFLDLLGIFVIGLVSALAVSSVSGSVPSKMLTQVLSTLGLSGMTSQYQAAVLGAFAASALIIKTLVSAYLSRRILFFLSMKAAVISGELVSKFLNRPLQKLSTNSLQSSLYSLTTGVQAVTVGVIGSTLLIAADSFLVFFIVLSLAIVDLGVAILSLLIFAGTGCILYYAVHRRAEKYGSLMADMTILNNQLILEVFSGYREILIRNRRSHYANQISVQRSKISTALAESTFIPTIGKYTLEVVIVVSGLVISGYQFWQNNATDAVGILSVYLVASSRMAPAVLRIQQSAVGIKTNLGAASPTLELVKELESTAKLEPCAENSIDSGHSGFIPEVSVKNLNLSYPGTDKIALQDISIEIKPGSFVGIVGDSGAGKSSLLDCILGVIQPNSGTVLISGKTPLDTYTQWPGAVGYVPQNVFISNGSLKENVTLGFDLAQISDDDVRECIDQAKLSDFVASLPLGLSNQFSEFQSQLSGGQRQRLGIARALFTKPRLILLDEATSSLDGKTELEISETIQSLKGNVTLIVVAHRLSTVYKADKIIYLSNGKVAAQGTFEQICSEVPEFKHQADLMGL